MKIFEHIKFMTLRVTFKAKREGNLPPYLTSTIRGVLGHCIRKLTCIYPQRWCNKCEQKYTCAYSQYFRSTGTVAGAVNPFVIHSFTQGKTHWEVNDTIVFNITLLGTAVASKELFLKAIYAMEKRGWGAAKIPFTLVSIVEAVSERLVYAGGKAWPENLQSHGFHCTTHKATSALIHFDTPLRIVKSDQLCRDIRFETLVRFISRRVSLLSQAYAGQKLEWDEQMYIAAAQVKTLWQQWSDVPFVRYSMNQKDNKLSLPAIQGWVLYEGDLEPFIPLLTVGQVFHVGKNATHGFGHYTIGYDK